MAKKSGSVKKSGSSNQDMRNTGSRVQVMNGNARKTPGGLTTKDLKYNKHGRIVSRKQSVRAKKDNRLVKAGYVTKKGVFGSKLVDPKGSPKKTSKKKSPRRKSSDTSFSFF